MKASAITWCENGHTCSIEVHRPVVRDGVVVGGFCGSAADFCNVCDGLVVQVWPAPLAPADALAAYVPSGKPGSKVPTVITPDGSVRVVHP